MFQVDRPHAREKADFKRAFDSDFCKYSSRLELRISKDSLDLKCNLVLDNLHTGTKEQGRR